MKVRLEVVVLLVALPVLSIAGSVRAGVNPGDTITSDQADKVADLVSPGNLILVKQGMTMKIVPSDRLQWPPPSGGDVEGCRGRAPFPGGGYKRPASRAEGDVEFQLPAALHRRCDIEE